MYCGNSPLKRFKPNNRSSEVDSMRRLFLLTCLTFALFGMQTATNLSGTWMGTVDVRDTDSGSVISTSVRLSLTQTKDAVTGKIGREGENEETPLQHVRLEGNKLTFEATNPDVNGPIKFVLTVTDDQMEGEMKASLDTGEINGKVRVTREKK
jgi:hypothetical protein